MLADLHSHSTASDGTLSPQQLLADAAAAGVELMAITDHDTLAGYLAVLECPQTQAYIDNGMCLIPGVELSCVWGNSTIHIVGLNMNVEHPALQAGLRQLTEARAQRALMIADRLERAGFAGAHAFVAGFDGARAIGRPDFARFLVEQHGVKDYEQAFKRYLGAGKAGDIKVLWPQLAEAIGWIRASGGIAVLAHPLNYAFTHTKLRALVADFDAAGGQALEVISGKQSRDRTELLVTLANRQHLYASIGSDFHGPGYNWCGVGQVGLLPASCQPVWELLPLGRKPAEAVV